MAGAGKDLRMLQFGRKLDTGTSQPHCLARAFPNQLRGLPPPPASTSPSGRPVRRGERCAAQRLRAHCRHVGRQPAGALRYPDPVPSPALLARPRAFPASRPIPGLLRLLHSRPDPLSPTQTPAADPGGRGLEHPWAEPELWGRSLSTPGANERTRPGPLEVAESSKAESAHSGRR